MFGTFDKKKNVSDAVPGCGKPSLAARERWGKKPNPANSLADDIKKLRALKDFLANLPSLTEDKIDESWQALQIPDDFKAGAGLNDSQKPQEQIFALFRHLKINQLLGPELIAKLETHFETAATLKPSPSPASE